MLDSVTRDGLCRVIWTLIAHQSTLPQSKYAHPLENAALLGHSTNT